MPSSRSRPPGLLPSYRRWPPDGLPLSYSCRPLASGLLPASCHSTDMRQGRGRCWPDARQEQGGAPRSEQGRGEAGHRRPDEMQGRGGAPPTWRKAGAGSRWPGVMQGMVGCAYARGGLWRESPRCDLGGSELRQEGEQCRP
jgi:hypothetical protein